VNYFDANTWIGRWPFAFLAAHTAGSLAGHLARQGIGRALVSPLDAVFAPEPGPANRALLRAVRNSGKLEPVPVINPALANWREELAACASDPRVRAVRVLPRYHHYRLGAPAVGGLVRELGRLRLRLIVQIRLIDERHEFHAMNLKPVPAGELGTFLRNHPALPVLAGGLLRRELLSLAPKHPRLIADLSWAEWHDTVPHLLESVPARQLAFATHTPFLVTAAGRAKLDTAAIPFSKRTAIAGANLEQFLSHETKSDRR